MELLFPGLPLWYTALTVFFFGVIIGSFLNVYIYRFHTGKSLSGSSHCLSCQTPLRWYELFPIVSYLVLRGRCRTCTAGIPSRYLWVELVTGLLFLSIVYTVPIWWLWPWYFLLIAVLVVVAVYDLYHFVIPPAFVYTLLGLALVYLGYRWYLVPDVYPLLWSLGGGLVGYGFFAVLWWYSGGRWVGYGDAKLAIPLGIMVGTFGAFSMIVLAFWIGATISLFLIAYLAWRRRGQARLPNTLKPLTIKSEVPFAPFLIAGFWLVFIYHVAVLELVSYVLPTI